ncbi:MAG: peptidoglycan editing factor PgeF [Spirochaetales bacterium]|nr:peptidoglycan editing factor PgeF [Spirochaetales bacterium]
MAYLHTLDIKKQQDIIEIPLFPENNRPSLNIRAYMTLKSAGNMAFSEQERLTCRYNIFKRLTIDKTKVYSLYQKHTRRVLRIHKQKNPGDYRSVPGDGMITSDKDIFLSITIADCLPIFIIDKQTSVYGIIHSGWQGTGIVKEAITLMETQCGVKRENIKIVIGPGIGECCYAVPAERYHYFASNFGEKSCKEKNGCYYINLYQANINILENIGIYDIDVMTNCTSCTPALHSFRRDGKDSFGLMMAIIGQFKD